MNKQAKENFDKAAALVKEGKYDAARDTPLMPSDRRIMEKRIAEHQAKRTDR